jgi:hypothetical protein
MDANQIFIKSIKNIEIGKSDTSAYFATVYHFVKMVAEGHSNALIIKSKGGIGKSFVVLKTLKEMNVPFVFLNAYSTPLSFFEFLSSNADKLILLDDCENVLKDKVSVSILKSALWSVTGTRVINYLSTTDKLKVPSSFIFTGKIIFCINGNLVKNADVQALKSRVLYHEINFTNDEIIKIMYEIAKDDYKDTTFEERKSIVDYLRENTDYSTDLNFRTLIKSYDIFRYSKINKIDWKPLVAGLITKDKYITVVKSLISSNLSIPDQIVNFRTATGKSQSSYYRLRSKLSNIQDLKNKK